MTNQDFLESKMQEWKDNDFSAIKNDVVGNYNIADNRQISQFEVMPFSYEKTTIVDEIKNKDTILVSDKFIVDIGEKKLKAFVKLNKNDEQKIVLTVKLR